MTPWKWTGVIAGGAGVIAVGIGGYLALAAKSDYDSVGKECPAQGCTSSAYNTRVNARSQADVATATMLIGAGAAIGGALLFFLAPTNASTARASTIRVGVGPGSATMTVGF
jgi:hypothetical protein